MKTSRIDHILKKKQNSIDDLLWLNFSGCEFLMASFTFSLKSLLLIVWSILAFSSGLGVQPSGRNSSRRYLEHLTGCKDLNLVDQQWLLSTISLVRFCLYSKQRFFINIVHGLRKNIPSPSPAGLMRGRFFFQLFGFRVLWIHEVEERFYVVPTPWWMLRRWRLASDEVPLGDARDSFWLMITVPYFNEGRLNWKLIGPDSSSGCGRCRRRYINSQIAQRMLADPTERQKVGLKTVS